MAGEKVSFSKLRLLEAARLGCAVLGALNVIVQFAALWISLDRLETEGVVLNSYPAVQALLSLDAFALYLLALRLLALAACWLGGALILARKPTQGGALLGALTLFGMPGLFILGEIRSSASVLNPWLALAADLWLGLAGLGFGMLALFYLSFPSWRPSSRLLTWLAGGASLLLALALVFTNNPQLGEAGWLISIVLLLSCLAGGIAVQLRRLWGLERAQRGRTAWVVAAMIYLPLVSFLSSMGAADQPWQTLAVTHLVMLSWFFLPYSLAEAVLRRGLWGGLEVTAQPSLRRAAGWGALALLAVLGLFLPLAGHYLAERPARQAAYAPLPPAAAPRPLIIDTDMGPDDWFAILYLLQRPEVSVKAITVTGAGEAHCEPGVRHALSLVALAGRQGVPVTCGRESPLQGSNAFPDSWRQSDDHLGGLQLAPGANPPGTPPAGAVDLLVETVRSSPQPVAILALGPLTNLAEAVQAQAGWQSNVSQVVIMGGALTAPGNLGQVVPENSLAEWNIYVDPLAAQITLASGLPILLTPLDATNWVPLTVDFYRDLQANRCAPAAQFTSAALSSRLALGGYYFWDVLAAALLVDESLGEIRSGRVSVETAPGPDLGATRLEAGGFAIRYAVSADEKRFRSGFLQTLNQACASRGLP